MSPRPSATLTTAVDSHSHGTEHSGQIADFSGGDEIHRTGQCAQRGGAPQGTRNFEERSGSEVYGAYTFFCREGDRHPPEGAQG